MSDTRQEATDRDIAANLRAVAEQEHGPQPTPAPDPEAGIRAVAEQEHGPQPTPAPFSLPFVGHPATYECYCEKCGWTGSAEAPRYEHPGCSYPAVRKPPAPQVVARYEPVTELRLCEQQYLSLRPGVLYRFTVDPDCARCRELAAPYEGQP